MDHEFRHQVEQIIIHYPIVKQLYADWWHKNKEI